MATPHKARLTALHAICVQIFRHIAQKSLAIRQYACGISVQSAEKSDYAPYAQALCGVALNCRFSQQNPSINNTACHVRIPQSGKLLPQLCGKEVPRRSGTVFNIVENHFGGRRRRFPQKIHQRGKLVENIFSQKIPVSGGLPVLIPKNQRFLSKTHCVSCGIL